MQNTCEALSIEAQMILLCARAVLADFDRKRLSQLLALRPKWTTVLDLADRHGLTPLLYRHLELATPDSVPPNVLAHLAHSAKHIAKHNFLLAAELLKLTTVFAAQEIPFQTYKGPTLAMQALNSLSDRVFVDLDLVLDERDVAKAQGALLDAGYTPEPRRSLPFTEKFMFSPMFRRLAHEQSFSRRLARTDQELSFVIDLHWRATENSLKNIESAVLVQNKEMIDVCRHEVPGFKKELLLLLLLEHGTKHRWSELKWLVDIAQILSRTPDFDWDKLYALGASIGIKRKIDLALLICLNSIGCASIPEDICTRIRADRVLQQLCSYTVSTWFSKKGTDHSLRAYMRYHALTFDSKQHSLTFLVREFFSPTVPTYLAVPLPGWLFCLYYVIHPCLTVFQFFEARLNRSQEYAQGVS